VEAPPNESEVLAARSRGWNQWLSSIRARLSGINLGIEGPGEVRGERGKAGFVERWPVGEANSGFGVDSDRAI
jgi:hypothetical protein